MAIRTIKTERLTWINIDEFDDVAAGFLRKNFKFHPLDLKDCRRDNLHPKVDAYRDYLFVIFNFPELSYHGRKVVMNELDVFFGKGFLVTVQKKKFKALKNCFYRCARNPKVKKEFFRGSSGFLLYKILEELFRSTSPIIDYIGNSISDIEEEIYSKKTSPQIVRELAIVRRNILSFRSIIDPQRFTINSLVHLEKPFLPKEAALYFDDIHDYIEETWVILNNYKDVVDGLHATNESLISNRTNEVIKVLTIISVALLPLTLLSGIYGMNIKGLPWAGDPKYVWLVFGALILIIISAIAYLRKKNWV